ncbi:MAG: S-layer homology domain-containing protein [Candidatus Abawacabacteria bacterium]|nr:S-layer homology domain-containing protein [Candidatus Abawacabacteria bacterium]
MKKLFSWLATFLFIISLAPQSAAALFPDLSSDHPNYTAIAFLRDRNVINGYPDGLYRPGNAVTRGEILKILMRAAGYTSLAPVSSNPFPDVSHDHAFAVYIQAAAQLGIIRGYDDGLFRMDRTVSRIEALKMLLLANNINTNTLPRGASYSDIALDTWYAPYARYALDHGLVDAFSGNTLRRDELLNRGLVAEMVYRFYRDRPDLLPQSPTPTPSPTSAQTPTPSPTPVQTPTPAVTTSPTVSSAPTPSATPTPEPTPSSAPSPEPTPTPTPTETPSSTPTPVTYTPSTRARIDDASAHFVCHPGSIDYSARVVLVPGTLDDYSRIDVNYYWWFGDGTRSVDLVYSYYHTAYDGTLEGRTITLPTYNYSSGYPGFLSGSVRIALANWPDSVWTVDTMPPTDPNVCP